MTAAPSTPPRPPRLRNGLLLVAAALLAALLVRAVAIEGFRIPSESMEGSLLVGDFVLVSKLHYGPRLPMSLGIPLTDVYARGVELPYLRLPGFTEVRRGDAVVFNYPPDTGPVDRRMHYIKRVVGLPGDTVAIRGKEVYVNGRRLDLGQGVQQRWVAHTTAPAAVSFDTLAALGAASVQMRGRRRDQLTFEGTRAAARRVEALAAVERVEPYLRDDPHFAVRIF
ncbi:MAG: signal peptidase I, partial [Rhodothermales bacterium]|nr:signal peptidase I [Rhodothermales bacterium]